MDGVFEVNTSEKLVYTGPVHCPGHTGDCEKGGLCSIVMGDSQISNKNGSSIPQEDGYGYRIILKAKNPFKTEADGVGFLIGGFGTLGTVAASHYFREHFKDLGKQFGYKCF